MRRSLPTELLGVAAGVALPEGLPSATPPADLSARVLASAAAMPRLGRFAGAVSGLLGIGHAHALELLRHIDTAARWEASPWPGVALYHLEPHLGDAPIAREAITGFVRLGAGGGFPDHEHLGDEVVLIVQGSCDMEDGSVARPGDLVARAPGTHHEFAARPGPDLVYLAIVRGGVRFGEIVMRPGTPDL